jgi:hypothetical protein
MATKSLVERPERAIAESLRQRPLEELRAEAEAQEARFVSGQTSFDAAALELFRRAVEEADETAWAAILELYRGLITAHCNRVVVRAFVHEDDRTFVERAFERFWLATRSSGLSQFADLASILKYLKLCLASVLLDEARARRRQLAVPLDEVSAEAHVSEDPVQLATSRGAWAELWAAVQAELRTDDERLVATASFAHGLTPREIRRRYASRFQDVGDVYRLKRNIVERLRHNAAIQALRG